ncbi:hypothetical protein SAMN05421877_102184 [Sphingobacterium lactis]|uniref:Uncharacterized protein n=1 Tax=Sphingobacterium lactis TaxID=797291 RepID=A0A1H5U757_9SPHI|nr:hypothetical protein SAMN05421877_102184 [Sphingobacterium lactis]
MINIKYDVNLLVKYDIVVLNLKLIFSFELILIIFR